MIRAKRAAQASPSNASVAPQEAQRSSLSEQQVGLGSGAAEALQRRLDATGMSPADAMKARQAASVNPDLSVTTKSGNTVTADASLVGNEKAWKAAVRKRDAVRAGVIEDAKAAVGDDPVALDQLQQIKSDLTNQSLPTQPRR